MGGVVRPLARIAASTAAPLLTNLSELLTRHVQEQPERTAVGTSDGGTVISYGQLDALVRSAMAQLSWLGLTRGTTIGLVADNCVEFVVGLLAVVSYGARVAPMNPALASSELSRRLSEVSAQAVLAPKHLERNLAFNDTIPVTAPPCIISIARSVGH